MNICAEYRRRKPTGCVGKRCRLRAKACTDNGFTLVEMLVVIAILALLISLLVPAVQSSLYRAKVTACASNLRQWGASLTAYASEHDGKYPDFPILSAIGPNPNGASKEFYRTLANDYGLDIGVWFCPARERTVLPNDGISGPPGSYPRIQLTDTEDVLRQMDLYGGGGSDWLMSHYFIWIPRDSPNGRIPSGTDSRINAPVDYQDWPLRAYQNETQPLVTDFLASYSGENNPKSGGHVFRGKEMGTHALYRDGRVTKRAVSDLHYVVTWGQWFNWY